jgi:hypothetical protein
MLPRLPLEALVLGTLTPDFQYLLYLAPRGRFGHTLLGLFAFCLPIGLIAWLGYTRWARPVILSLLPGRLRSTLGDPRPRPPLVAAAILIGAASHSLWDSFTHGHGWAVRHIPALTAPVGLGDGLTVRGYKLLQHGSTILGLSGVVVWILIWFRRQPVELRRYSDQERSQATRTAALLLAAAVAGAFANGLRGLGRGPAFMLGLAAVGAMAAVIVALMGLGITQDPRL